MEGGKKKLGERQGSGNQGREEPPRASEKDVARGFRENFDLPQRKRGTWLMPGDSGGCALGTAKLAPARGTAGAFQMVFKGKGGGGNRIGL